MDKKLLAIILTYIVLGSALGLGNYLYFELDNKHTKLQSEYNSLLNNYNLLQTSCQTLNDTHQTLVNDYTSLNRTHQILILEYNKLNASYQSLELNYTKLNQDFNDLFNDYSAILEAFNKPLSYEEIPSTYELEQWLATDKTDEISYNDPNFKCGDFAVMLSQHAKLQQWDMGVVAVFGYTETYTSYAHAFNAIITIEGLVYVEPQNDHVWWYSDHQEIYEDAWFEIDDEWVYVQEYVVIVSFD